MIEIFVDGVEPKLNSFETLPAGSKGVHSVHVLLSPEWEEKYKYFDKLVCFDNGTDVFTAPLIGDTVMIPEGALSVPDVYLKVVIYAECPTENGMLARPTKKITLGYVRPSAKSN